MPSVCIKELALILEYPIEAEHVLDEQRRLLAQLLVIG